IPPPASASSISCAIVLYVAVVVNAAVKVTGGAGVKPWKKYCRPPAPLTLASAFRANGPSSTNSTSGLKSFAVPRSVAPLKMCVSLTPSPVVNDTHIFNGATLLGTANDLSPLVLFVDDGPFALNADANVNGAGGLQYFFQGFTPAPPVTLTAAFTTTATYKTMAQLIDDALAGGGIYGPGADGLANSYRHQFAAVQADMASRDYAQALTDLQSFISHVQAQSGKHVTPALATTLQLDALLVYHNALCLAVGAAQIDAATASADYTFYSNLESSLGGTVLPPC